MTKINLLGKQAGWLPTGLSVSQPYDWIAVRASGKMNFALGNHWRDPEGRDENGHQEIPAGDYDDQFGAHPAPGFIKNSLCLRVGNWGMQGGNRIANYSPTTGPIEMTQNDNLSGDNDGHWEIELDVWRPYPASITKFTIAPAPNGVRVEIGGKFEPAPKGFVAKLHNIQDHHDVTKKRSTFTAFGKLEPEPQVHVGPVKAHDFVQYFYYKGLPSDLTFAFQTSSGLVQKKPNS